MTRLQAEGQGSRGAGEQGREEASLDLSPLSLTLCQWARERSPLLPCSPAPLRREKDRDGYA